jgi:hypothetical protein
MHPIPPRRRIGCHSAELVVVRPVPRRLVARHGAGPQCDRRGTLVIAFEWNTLRVGDQVVVHEHSAERYRIPQPGVVAFVTIRRPTNEVGIRIDPSSGTRVLWPTSQEVHAATPAAAAACPYCVLVDGRVGTGATVPSGAVR